MTKHIKAVCQCPACPIPMNRIIRNGISYGGQRKAEIISEERIGKIARQLKLETILTLFLVAGFVAQLFTHVQAMA